MSTGQNDTTLAEEKSKKIVLDEDEFATRGTHHREDYFPDVPRMKEELRLLRAEREERTRNRDGEEEYSEAAAGGRRNEEWE